MKSGSFDLQDSNREKKEEWETIGNFDEEKEDVWYKNQVRVIEYLSPDKLFKLSARQYLNGMFDLQLEIDDVSVYKNFLSKFQKKINHPKVAFFNIQRKIEITISSLDDLAIGESFLSVLDEIVGIGYVRKNCAENIKKYLFQFQNIPTWTRRGSFNEPMKYIGLLEKENALYRLVEYHSRVSESKISDVALIQFCDGAVKLYKKERNAEEKNMSGLSISRIESSEHLKCLLREEPSLSDLTETLLGAFAVTEEAGSKARLREVVSELHWGLFLRFKKSNESAFLPTFCKTENQQFEVVTIKSGVFEAKGKSDIDVGNGKPFQSPSSFCKTKDQWSESQQAVEGGISEAKGKSDIDPDKGKSSQSFLPSIKSEDRFFKEPKGHSQLLNNEVSSIKPIAENSTSSRCLPGCIIL